MGGLQNRLGMALPSHPTALRLLLVVQLVNSCYSFTATRTKPAIRKLAAGNAFTDDEWHPHDPAYTTPQLLVGIWDQIAQAKDMERGETHTVIYPEMEEQLNDGRFMDLMFAHLDCCKDVCDHFGITTTLIPYNKEGKIVGFTVRSFSSKKIGTANVENGEFEFEYDPFWDDGTDFEALYGGVDDEDMEDDPYPQIENKIPDDDEEIITVTKAWVDSMMSDMGVCPFTQSADRAGLPIGDVFYCVDRCTSFEDMYARYWKEVVRVEQNPEKDLSTTLLIAPEFCIDNVELFESFTNTLTQPLTALGVEDLLQLVFFHPVWVFRDGGARAGNAQAANYARRSPWPMINILRTNQVRAAQKGIPTGLVYKQNEKTLSNIGVDKLETMLRLRDWADTEEYKVNRQEVDALKIAQDFQSTGSVSKQDTSMTFDATPAANKVDRDLQTDQGNLINVLRQALDKRLGKGDDSIAPLSGPETSAVAMAADVLIEELDAIVSKQTQPTTKAESAVEEAETTLDDPPVNLDESTPDEVAATRQKKMEEARRALLADLMGDDDYEYEPPPTDNIRGDPMQDALFGRGGIKERLDEDDEVFPEGMNPDTFY